MGIYHAIRHGCGGGGGAKNKKASKTIQNALITNLVIQTLKWYLVVGHKKQDLMYPVVGGTDSRVHILDQVLVSVQV